MSGQSYYSQCLPQSHRISDDTTLAWYRGFILMLIRNAVDIAAMMLLTSPVFMLAIPCSPLEQAQRTQILLYLIGSEGKTCMKNTYRTG
jgi:hypothetical protein